MPDYFSVGAFRDFPSWHQKEMTSGGIFTGQTTIMEQLKRSEMDYEVVVSPSFYEWNGEYVEVPGKYHVVVPRTSWNPTPKSIRQIGNRYEVLQNRRIAEILEPIQEQFPLEGLGVLKNGKVVFFELKMDSFEVGDNPNETHESYLMLSNDHCFGSAFFGQTYTRIVCANTYGMALGDDRVESIPHSTDVNLELEFRTAVIHNALEARKSHKNMLDRMFNTKIDQQGIAQLVESTFSYPKRPRAMRVYEAADPVGLNHSDEVISTMADKASASLETWERSKERQDELRLDVIDAFHKFNDEQPYCANSVYSAFNATNEILNHSPRFYGDVSKNMVSLFFGQKNQMLQNAWRVCEELVKV